MTKTEVLTYVYESPYLSIYCGDEVVAGILVENSPSEALLQAMVEKLNDWFAISGDSTANDVFPIVMATIGESWFYLMAQVYAFNHTISPD